MTPSGHIDTIIPWVKHVSLGYSLEDFISFCIGILQRRFYGGFLIVRLEVGWQLIPGNDAVEDSTYVRAPGEPDVHFVQTRLKISMLVAFFDIFYFCFISYGVLVALVGSR